ncbi:MAG TPA: ATP-binding protein, partial [Bryobacteraceae bacterium]
VILGYNGMVMDELSDQPWLLEKAAEVQRAAERAAGLTKQLLAFSRRQILQPSLLDLNEVVNNIEKLLRHVIGEDIDFATRLDPSLFPVRADATHLDQVLMNLVINARDAMPNGGKLTIETANVVLDEVYAESHAGIVPGRYVHIAVSDTGHGMSEETRRKIFEPFFTTKEVGKGTGLGLSIVYGIVKQNGGDIWVYSQEGKGTTFKIHLPAVTDQSATKPSVSSRVPARAQAEVVLLVEDDANVRKLVEGVLREHGFQVVASENIAEAIALCKERDATIDLLLTDVVMPDMSGPELAEELAKLRPGLKVVYMSGYADNAVVRHGVLKPGAAFIEKPFVAETLTEKLREVLAG